MCRWIAYRGEKIPLEQYPNRKKLIPGGILFTGLALLLLLVKPVFNKNREFAVADLAKCLNMTSTAEGVETQLQLEALQRIGCTEMQGYLFSRARPAKEVHAFFARPAASAADVA